MPRLCNDFATCSVSIYATLPNDTCVVSNSTKQMQKHVVTCAMATSCLFFLKKRK